MFKIPGITTDPFQERTLILPDNTEVLFRMNFIDQQLGWFITDFTYMDFNLYGIRIVNSPNLLQKYSYGFPFGLSCVSAENREPFFLDDFFKENSNLYILTKDEVSNLGS